MKAAKKKKLQAAGWRVGSTRDFLGLSAEEEMVVAMRLALADSLKSRRQSLRLTQSQFAKRVGSSQSRVAKMEAADGSVTLDLLVRSLASLGATRSEIGRIVGASSPKSPKNKSAKKKTTTRKRVRAAD